MEDIKEAPLTSSIEQVSDEPRTPELKKDDGVTLIPRPSDDPRDPLVKSIFLCWNWTTIDLCLELAHEQEDWHRCSALLSCILWLCSTTGRSTQCQVTGRSLRADYNTHRVASMLRPPIHMKNKINPSTELGSFSRSRYRRVFLRPRFFQARPKLSHILDLDCMPPHTSLGCSHDQT